MYFHFGTVWDFFSPATFLEFKKCKNSTISKEMLVITLYLDSYNFKDTYGYKIAIYIFICFFEYTYPCVILEYIDGYLTNCIFMTKKAQK